MAVSIQNIECPSMHAWISSRGGKFSWNFLDFFLTYRWPKPLNNQKTQLFATQHRPSVSAHVSCDSLSVESPEQTSCTMPEFVQTNSQGGKRSGAESARRSTLRSTVSLWSAGFRPCFFRTWTQGWPGWQTGWVQPTGSVQPVQSRSPRWVLSQLSRFEQRSWMPVV